jgi:hypothetical protein
MLKASRGDPFLAEISEGPEVDPVFQYQADGKISEDLTEGLETLRSAYQEFWAEIHPPAKATASNDSETPPSTAIKPGVPLLNKSIKLRRARAVKSQSDVVKPRLRTRAKVRGPNRPAKKAATTIAGRRRARKTNVASTGRPPSQRFGLPEGFVPRVQRFGRGILLERNIYSLPDGQELIPCLPTGQLGSRHLYALLTAEQHLRGSRGSIYIRADGKIFDYSVVSENPLGDMFDTGYTIYDLERTGRYAPEVGSTRQTSRVIGKVRPGLKQKSFPKKSRRAASRG